MSILGIAMAVLGVLVGAAVAVVATVILGLRFRSRTVRKLVSTLNRRVINPRNLVTAGTTASPWSVVRHRGRVSGREFSTPVEAVATDGGFVVALPYGPESDWVRNVVAASNAVLVTGGAEHQLDAIEIVPIASTPFANTDRFGMWLFGVRWAVLLRPVGG